MSPTKQRTERWLQAHSPGKMDSGINLRKVQDGGIVKRDRPEQPNQRKKRTSFWNLALWFSGSGNQGDDREEDTDLEGDTMIDDAGSAATTGYDNDLTLVVDDYNEGGAKGAGTAHAFQKYSDHHLAHDDPRVRDWTQEERWLFTKLSSRGYEPLLHNTWVMDYPTFPAQLFSDDESQVYINNIHSSTGRGMHH